MGTQFHHPGVPQLPTIAGDPTSGAEHSQRTVPGVGDLEDFLLTQQAPVVVEVHHDELGVAAAGRGGRGTTAVDGRRIGHRREPEGVTLSVLRFER